MKSATMASGSVPLPRLRRRSSRKALKTDLEAGDPDDDDDDDSGENGVLWAVGNASDDEGGEDEDVDHHQHPSNRVVSASRSNTRLATHGEEGRGLFEDGPDEDDMDSVGSPQGVFEEVPFRDSDRT
ncbi:hypothetical protein BDP27DRAFT_1323433 [Rhodocollybia butyracea]|uniref:Uncharacterized protein n=1 Tax=Rhodocollybia butyracea TaxID=206335 RepID=A0A9P5PQX7_9AGAR|nr:hypothetical protein BDP27DRAFT_1323433 [Rhodocollybia butyracea]